jgi:hypothetical protein
MSACAGFPNTVFNSLRQLTLSSSRIRCDKGPDEADEQTSEQTSDDLINLGELRRAALLKEPR